MSALSMLTGCYALSRALGLQPGPWKPLAVLMGVLQLYELLLLGLAVLLFRRVRMPSDARMAFMLGLLFLVDSTYLNTELATASPWTAPWVALAHLAFLVPKLFVLRDVLGLTSLRTLALTVAQIGVLLYVPGTFSAVHFMDGKVHALGLGRQMLPLVVYGLWWLVGSLPLVYLWADRPSEHGENPVARHVSRAALFLPFASMLLHLFTLHWMYELPIHGSYLTPLVLGVLTNVAHTMVKDANAWGAPVKWGAPLFALWLSLGHPETLTFTLGELAVLSPVRLALLGIAVVFWIHRVLSERAYFAWPALAALVLAVSGHSFPTMKLRWAKLFPETYAEYGLAAMVAAFALLALALAISLWRPQTPPSQMPNSRGARYAG